MTCFEFRLPSRGVLLAATLVLAACGGVTDTERTAVSSVSLSQSSVNLEVGASQQLTVEVRDAAGNLLSDRQVFWSSNDTTIARVSAAGMVTGITPGAAQIAASVERSSDVASVAVLQRPVASVGVSPDNASVPARQVIQLAATTYDAGGQVLTGRAVSWESSNPDVATVDASGQVRGVRPGIVTITASSEGRSGTASVVVTAGPPSQLMIVSGSAQTAPVGGALPDPLVVRVTDADGNPVPGVTVSWATASGSGVVQPASSVTDAAGIARAQWRLGAQPGDHSATATLAGVGSVTFTALARANRVNSVTVTPGSTTLNALNGTVALTATAYDASGNVVPDRSVTWTTSQPASVAVSSTGVATALANGTSTVSAEVEGVTGSATVRVTQAVAQVAVTPATASVVIGTPLQLSAAATDANGFAVAGAAITWTTSNSAVATVSNTGVVSGRAAGSATISASSGGRTGSASVTVQNVSVATVSVTPGAATRKVGESVQLQATTYDAAGNVLTDRAVRWTSSNPNVASVNASGRVSALRPGSVTITATSEGRAGTASVTVESAPPARLEIHSGDDQRGTKKTPLPDPLAVRVTDAQNNPVPGVTVTWTIQSGKGTVTPASSETDANGIARTQWTLGSKPGSQKARASVTGISSVTFSAQAR
ncbi:MAG TPA: Ig-like domain-containing protein [Longimicrobiaceae bacterium]|nr:Ig-like domain-containing protein [Longimicrobiaceae bacterium]